MKRKSLMLIPLLSLLFLNIFYAVNKNFFHGDEVLSYSLALSEDPFFDEITILKGWNSSHLFRKYLTLSPDNFYHFNITRRNQVWDVHPPLYYYLLRIFSIPYMGSFSWWPGWVLNFCLSLIQLYLMYRIFVSLSINHVVTVTTLTLYVVSPLTLGAFSLQRMYLLLSVTITAFVWMQIKNFEQRSFDWRLLIIGVLGALTHYYFLFFLMAHYLFILVSQKLNFKKVMELSAIIMGGIVLFPASIKHINSYRSIEAQQKLIEMDVENLLNRIGIMLELTQQQFLMTNAHEPILLLIFFAVITATWIFTTHKKRYAYLLGVLSVFFLLASILSPFTTLRYVSPVFFLIFVFIGLMQNELLRKIPSRINHAIIILLILLVCSRLTDVKPHSYEHLSAVNYFKASEIERVILIHDEAFQVMFAAQFLIHKREFKLIRWQEELDFSQEKAPFFLLNSTGKPLPLDGKRISDYSGFQLHEVK
jgi:hypothetical protein